MTCLTFLNRALRSWWITLLWSIILYKLHSIVLYKIPLSESRLDFINFPFCELCLSIDIVNLIKFIQLYNCWMKTIQSLQSSVSISNEIQFSSFSQWNMCRLITKFTCNVNEISRRKLSIITKTKCFSFELHVNEPGLKNVLYMFTYISFFGPWFNFFIIAHKKLFFKWWNDQTIVSVSGDFLEERASIFYFLLNFWRD